MPPRDEYKLAILVVLYNKQIEECVTISSLCDSLEKIEFEDRDVLIYIWNNGPSTIDYNSASDRCQINLVETIDNNSLSVIYNTFINEIIARNYLLLDHDSVINPDYLRECFSNHEKYLIPLVMTSNGMQSPKFYRMPSHSFGKTMLAIGSGICLSKAACEELKKHYGEVFDERFFFYGVDSTFFLRINKIGNAKKIKVSSQNITHSLSRLEAEDESTTKFRVKERSYDQALTLRYYFSIFTFFTVLKKIIASVSKSKSEISLKFFMVAFFNGKHYKSKKR